MPRNVFRLLGFGALLLAPAAQAQWAVIDAAADALHAQQLVETIKQTANMVQQVNQARQQIQMAEETLGVTRDVYAGIGDFKNFSSGDFLGNGKAYFLSNVPLVSDAYGLVSDIGENGLRGGSVSGLASRVDAYRDAKRRAEAASSGVSTGTPYDTQSTNRFAVSIEQRLASQGWREGVIGNAEGSPAHVASASEGLFVYDMSREDPALADLYTYRRARARESEQAALKAVKESMDASVGKSQQLTAKTSAMSTVELSRLNETQSQALTHMELERSERAAAAAQNRQEHDALWNNISNGIDKRFGHGPKDEALPSMETK